MELQEVYGLMDRFAASGLTALEWARGEERISLRREGTASPAAAPAPVPAARAEEEGEAVASPLVGVFYAASAPEEPPYVTPGARVKKGDTLCLIEAMKMMSEVPAPCDCVIEEVLKANGELAAFGEPLFRYRPC